MLYTALISFAKTKFQEAPIEVLSVFFEVTSLDVEATKDTLKLFACATYFCLHMRQKC